MSWGGSAIEGRVLNSGMCVLGLSDIRLLADVLLQSFKVDGTVDPYYPVLTSLRAFLKQSWTMYSKSLKCRDCN